MATVTLNWRDTNYGETEHRVYRDTAPLDPQNPPAPIATAAAGATSYADTTAADNETYYYAVSALVNGQEYFSSELTVDTFAGIPVSGLVAWYTMDNISGSTLVDEQGNFDGTIVGATPVAGANGQALRFSASSDRVEVTNIIGGLSQWTICVICNPVDNVNGTLFEYDWSDAGGSAILLNEPAENRLRFYYRYSAASAIGIFTNPLPSAPCCLIFGFDGTDIFVDIDGVMTKEPFPYTVTPRMGVVGTIGNRETYANDFGGWVDDWGVYNRTLTESEKSSWRAKAV